jgi:hypothetical protein
MLNCGLEIYNSPIHPYPLYLQYTTDAFQVPPRVKPLICRNNLGNSTFDDLTNEMLSSWHRGAISTVKAGDDYQSNISTKEVEMS